VLGKLKSAKSEAEVEGLAKSIPDVGVIPIDLPTTSKEKNEEDAIRDIIARMKETLASNGERELELQNKFFDWMSCQPSHPLHPVCLLTIVPS
jgi:hypothetical protein